MIFSKISNIRPFSTFLLPANSQSLSLVSLLKSGFTPTTTHFNQFLLFLSKSKRFKLIIHLVKSNQFKEDSKTRRIFIQALVKEDKYDEAVQYLKKKNTQMEKSLFDSLIQPLCKRNPEKALSILQDCSVEKELEALHQEEQILASKGTQGCGLVVNEVVENLEVSGIPWRCAKAGPDTTVNKKNKKYWPLKLGVRKLGTMDLVVFFLKQKHRGIWTFLQRPFKTLWHFICTFADYT